MLEQRRYTIKQFAAADTASYFEFATRLPENHNFVKSVSVVSPEYFGRAVNGVDVKLSLMNNNKRDFIGNPVVSLGHLNDPRKASPKIEIGNFYDSNYFNGYVKMLQNELGEPVTILLIIETEYRNK